MIFPVCLHEAGMADMLERCKFGSEFRGHFLAFCCIYLSKGAVCKHFGLNCKWPCYHKQGSEQKGGSVNTHDEAEKQKSVERHSLDCVYTHVTKQAITGVSEK